MKGIRIYKPVAAMIVLLSAIFCLNVSCQPPKPEAKGSAGIHRRFEKGPVQLEVDVDRKSITTADRLAVRFAASAPWGYELTLPDTLAEQKDTDQNTTFRLVEVSAPSVEMGKDNRTHASRTYLLEPFLAGNYHIPALTVGFRKAGEEAGGTLDSERIPITVTSLLMEANKNAEMPAHDIRPPAPLPPEMAAWYWAAGIAGGILLMGLGGFLMVRKRRKARLIAAEMVIPPHEAAFSALDALMEANLIEKGKIKAFYQEISGILRRYIEARFGLRAPEQTTEEFLEGLKTGAALDIRYQVLLKQFLTHCDLVKFAAHHPSAEDIRNTLESCRTFVQETRSAGENM